MTKGLLTSNSLQCAVKRIRIECAFNSHSIHIGTFHITKMQCALSNKRLRDPHIESKLIAFQNGGVISHFKNTVFWHSVVRLHYRHKMARERGKYVEKKRAEERRKL